MNKKLYFSGLLLSLSLAAGQAFAQNAAPLRFATEGAFAPWNLVSPSGKLEGFEIDLIQDLCKRMSRTCEVSAQAWDGIIPGLNLGKYDAIAASMNINEKRLEVVDFSVPYANATISFATLKANPLAAIGPGERFSFNTRPTEAQVAVDELKKKLKGKVIGVQSSTGGSGMLEREFANLAEIRFYKKPEELILDLKTGRIDAALAQKAFWVKAASEPESKDLVTFGPELAGGKLGIGIAVAIRKNEPALKASLDSAVKGAIADGTVKSLSTKWFGTDMSPVE